ncbi:hypothetical protein [Brunnivagina elsteri]|uniref:hypothetical protein n=1 Tax=Brunnivagina elsteri TaxID=1247191 RepID=UPI001B8022B7|nr:hypothetical protein [Calothrix elsteri]
MKSQILRSQLIGDIFTRIEYMFCDDYPLRKTYLGLGIFYNKQSLIPKVYRTTFSNRIVSTNQNKKPTLRS